MCQISYVKMRNCDFSLLLISPKRLVLSLRNVLTFQPLTVIIGRKICEKKPRLRKQILSIVSIYHPSQDHLHSVGVDGAILIRCVASVTGFGLFDDNLRARRKLRARLPKIVAILHV